MININDDCSAVLVHLGQRLKEARLERNESQEIFAARLGLTRQSYGKMEKGAPSVPIAYWIIASHILGRLQTWDKLLSGGEDLFSLYEQKKNPRQRARIKRITKND